MARHETMFGLKKMAAVCDSTSARKKKGDDCTRTKPLAYKDPGFCETLGPRSCRNTPRVSQAVPTLNSSSHNSSVMPILIHASQRAALLPQSSNLSYSRDFLPLVLDFSILIPGILAVSCPKISSCTANCDIMFAHPASDCPSCLENPPPDPKSCHPHGPSRVLR